MAAVHHRFEWDADKALENERKHGVDFMFAANVLADPQGDAHHLEVYDSREDYGEDRWITIGTAPTDRSVTLVVAWTMRGDATQHGSFPLARRHAVSRPIMSRQSDNNLVRVEAVGVSEPTQAQINRVKAINETAIDTTDVPELARDDFARAERPTILRLDPANRRWLMSQPNPSQLMDDLIREHRNQRTG